MKGSNINLKTCEMKKNILVILLIILGLHISTNASSQSQNLSSGEKTGLMIDSLLKTNPVDAVEIRHHFVEQKNNVSTHGHTSKNFRVSGQFIIIKVENRKNTDDEFYYNLEKVLYFVIRNNNLILYLEV